jgi:hypothetical protein
MQMRFIKLTNLMARKPKQHGANIWHPLPTPTSTDTSQHRREVGRKNCQLHVEGTVCRRDPVNVEASLYKNQLS